MSETATPAYPQNSGPWEKYICIACGLIYDEAEGDPDSGLAPGTRFCDIPDDWECPVCGVTKKDFKPFVRQDRVPVAVATAPVRETGVIIVGAGMAGWAMAEAIRSRDEQMPITMITACSGDRYNKPELSVSFSRTPDRDQLVRNTATHEAQKLGINLISDTFVVSVSPSCQQVRTTRGSFDYTKLVIAQGSRTVLPDPMPENLCWRINLLNDWNALLPKLKRSSKRIAVVGAGMVGCELAEDLCSMGHDVFLLSRNSLPLSSVLPDAAGKRVLSAQTAQGITFLHSKDIVQIVQNNDGLKSIRFSTDDILNVDEIIATTGVATDKRIAQRAQLAFNNGIVVNPQTLETSQSNIYAVGDCVSFDGEAHRFIGLIEQQVNVVAEAVLNSSRRTRYEYNPPPVVLKTKSCPVQINGTPDSSAPWTIVQETEQYLLMQQSLANNKFVTISVGRPG